MPASDAYGPLFPSGAVTAAVRTHLRDNGWLTVYLAEMERQTGRAARTLPEGRAWRTGGQIDQWLGDVPPAVLIACPGTIEPPETTSSVYRARWDVRVAVIVQTAGNGDPDELAGVYGAAVRGALVQHPTLGGFARGIRWLGEDLDEVPGRQAATTAMAVNRFSIDIDDVLRLRTSQPDPPDDPYTPPDPYPDSPLEADITVDLEENP